MNWRARLHEAINQSGKKHSIIAEDAGITPATLSRVLTGVHGQPRFETIMRITHAVGERVGWVCEEEGFSLDNHQRAKVRTVAGILMDMTRSNPHNQK
jgi:transcriptional regulator with XRE-family HTH domain